MVYACYGVKVCQIIRKNAASGYHLGGVLEWDSREAYQNTQSDERAKELLDDVGSGRFTTSQPLFLEGDLVV